MDTSKSLGHSKMSLNDGTASIESNDSHFKNFKFVDNSESSSQARDSQSMDLKNIQISNSKLIPPQTTILPLSLPSTITGSETRDGQVSDNRRSQAKCKSLAEMGFKTNEVEGWDNIVQPPKENLYKLLRQMVDENIKPNVQIRIGQVNFNCHMIVLQCYSKFFMDLSNEVLVQLPEDKITPRAFMMTYKWMLADEPLVQREGILELFNAANFLAIKDLINQCWYCLEDDISFQEDAAFMLYLEARNLDLEIVGQLMLMRICKFFLTLVAAEEFLTLNVKEVCTLLNSNTIGINSEMEILMSAVRWLCHDWSKRKQYVLDVIKCVRFSLMPTIFLITLTNPTDYVEIDRIVTVPEVKQMINDAITYTTTQSHYGGQHDEFMHFLERYQLETPMKRHIIYDKECNYHHYPECPNRFRITYRSFLDYLEMIQTIGKDYWHSLELTKDLGMAVQCCGNVPMQKPNREKLSV